MSVVNWDYLNAKNLKTLDLEHIGKIFQKRKDKFEDEKFSMAMKQALASHDQDRINM